MTVAETQEVEKTVTYCDICGGDTGTLIEFTDKTGTARHFHSDCIEDITVDSPTAPIGETTTQSSGFSFSPLSIPTPSLRLSVPPVLDEVVERSPPLATLLLFLSRILAWPVIGLWIADEVDVFGGESISLLGEYLLGLLVSGTAWIFIFYAALLFA